MPIRGALRASLLLVLALSIAACPAPTGRRRGVDAAAGTCSEPQQPFTGFPCRINSERCDFEQPCGFNGVLNTTCTCNGGIWNCVSNGLCQVVMRDSGPMECPSHAVQQDEICAARQGGLYCPGVARACDDSGTVPANCYCTGTLWSCRATGCRDGGPPSCPPSLPQPFDTCESGSECFYPASVSHTRCPVRCTCQNGSFACFQDCFVDVPEGDATDVASEATPDDSGDAAVDATLGDDASDVEPDGAKPMDAGDLDAATE